VRPLPPPGVGGGFPFCVCGDGGGVTSVYIGGIGQAEELCRGDVNDSDTDKITALECLRRQGGFGIAFALPSLHVGFDSP